MVNSKILQYSFFETPLGSMYMIVDNQFLYILKFGNQEQIRKDIVLLQQKIKISIIEGKTKITHLVEHELQNYFNGTLKQFSVPLTLIGTNFQKEVWQELQKIPFGTTISYQNLATNIRNKNATRAVGSTNAKNNIAIIIPCHRVINKNKNIGGYNGGVEKKEWLLHFEYMQNTKKQSII